MSFTEHFRNLSQVDRAMLADRCGTSVGHLRNIAFSGKACAPLLAMAIELATDRRVRRWDLRPDDWHLIWHELVGTDGAPAVPVGEVSHG